MQDQSRILALQVKSLAHWRAYQIIIGCGKYRYNCTALNLDSLHVRR